VPLNFNQEKTEADLRYSLVRLRENSESVAFFGGEGLEAAQLQKRLQRAVENLTGLLVVQRNLGFFTAFYRYLITLLPTAVVAPLFFRGDIELGVVTQSNSAFSHILSDVSLFVLQLDLLASFSAIVDRLGEFAESLEVVGSGPETLRITSEPLGAAGPTLLRTTGLTLWAPAQRGPLSGRPSPYPPGDGGGAPNVAGDRAVLVSDLALEVTKGTNLLIMGPSGTGKTTLLRSLAGLWPLGEGTVTMYGERVRAGRGVADIFFVPQRPYLPLGTLRDIVLYPMWKRSGPPREKASGRGSQWPPRWVDTLIGTGGFTGVDDAWAGERAGAGGAPAEVVAAGKPVPTDAEVARALQRVGLGKLLGRYGGGEQALAAEADWASVLSVGEQQRVSFARLLLARPELALMDESTSALDTANEARMYEELSAEGVTVVSVGHRPTLLSFHDRLLEIAPGGGWQTRGISAKDPSAARE